MGRGWFVPPLVILTLAAGLLVPPILRGLRSTYTRPLAVAVGELEERGTLQAHLDRGRELIKEGDHEGAIRAFEAALEINPDSKHALDGIGRALHAQGRFAEAGLYARKTIALEPHNARGHASLGSCLLAQNQHQEALDAYARVVELAPGNPDGPSGMGRPCSTSAGSRRLRRGSAARSSWTRSTLTGTLAWLWSAGGVATWRMQRLTSERRYGLPRQPRRRMLAS